MFLLQSLETDEKVPPGLPCFVSIHIPWSCNKENNC
jgi:hypothetical protein